MKWDYYMFLLESNSIERYQLVLVGIYIHIKTDKPYHEAKCNKNIRNFITKNEENVTCEKCLELLKK